MYTGGDSFDDTDRIRPGGTKHVTQTVYAPSTLRQFVNSPVSGFSSENAHGEPWQLSRRIVAGYNSAMTRVSKLFATSLRRALGESRYETALTRAYSLIKPMSPRSSKADGSKPLISVIVPIYNTQAYLSECLESIQRQSYSHLEVIMLDDGSADRSSSIAQEFARDDSRFRYYWQTNGGQSAARNAALQLAAGDFLSFVDSDDALAPDAYRDLLSALQRSGSDFAIGGLERWHAHSRWRIDWVTRVHSSDRLGVTIDEVPEAVKDVFPCNKLYRADFFRRAIGGYAVGVRYEDHEPAAKGFTACRTFDLLQATTYYWRIRDDGSSITQDQTTAADLTDRIAALHIAEQIYKHRASEEVYRAWLQDTAGLGIGSYYWTITSASDEYWHALRELVDFFFSALNDRDWGHVTLRERLMAGVIAAGDRTRAEKLASLLNNQQERQAGIAVQADEAGYCVDTAQLGISDLRLPAPIIRLSLTDLRLRTGFTTLGWLAEGDLQIDGFCYIDYVNTEIHSSNIRCWLQFADGNQRELGVHRYRFPRDSPWLPGNGLQNYPASGIKVVIPTSDLYAPCSVHLELEVHHARQQGTWRPQDPESVPMIRPFATADGRVTSVSADPVAGLQIDQSTHKLVTSGLVIGTEGLVTFRVSALAAHPEMRIRASNHLAGLSVDDYLGDLSVGQTRTVRLWLPRAMNGPLETQWSFTAICGDRELPMPFPYGEAESLTMAEDGYLGLRTSHQADLRLSEAPWSAVITEVTGQANALQVRGLYQSAPEIAVPKLVAVRLDGVLFNSSQFTVDDGSGTFDATVPLRDPDASVPSPDEAAQHAFGLCVMAQEETDIWSRSRPLHFDNRAWNGHRYGVKVGTERFDVTDSGGYRSALVRKSQLSDIDILRPTLTGE